MPPPTPLRFLFVSLSAVCVCASEDSLISAAVCVPPIVVLARSALTRHRNHFVSNKTRQRQHTLSAGALWRSPDSKRAGHHHGHLHLQRDQPWQVHRTHDTAMATVHSLFALHLLPHNVMQECEVGELAR
jgi:hypothetical protein